MKDFPFTSSYVDTVVTYMNQHSNIQCLFTGRQEDSEQTAAATDMAFFQAVEVIVLENSNSAFDWLLDDPPTHHTTHQTKGDINKNTIIPTMR